MIESERLYLREMTQADYPALCKILQDEDVMHAYEGTLSDEETLLWLNQEIARYQEEGFGLWAVIVKQNDEMIGQCGLTNQKWKDKTVLEIGYLFQKAFWHHGYAIEAARACKEYAFTVLNADEVFSIIRDTNIASQNVAKKNGMLLVDESVRQYRGIDIPHYLFASKRLK